MQNGDILKNLVVCIKWNLQLFLLNNLDNSFLQVDVQLKMWFLVCVSIFSYTIQLSLLFSPHSLLQTNCFHIRSEIFPCIFFIKMSKRILNIFCFIFRSICISNRTCWSWRNRSALGISAIVDNFLFFLILVLFHVLAIHLDSQHFFHNFISYYLPIFWHNSGLVIWSFKFSMQLLWQFFFTLVHCSFQINLLIVR